MLLFSKVKNRLRKPWRKAKKTFSIKKQYDWASVGCDRKDIFDAAINYVIWGVDPKQYIINEFYKKSHKEKRSFMTGIEGQQIADQLKQNCTPEELSSIANKYVFNKTYSQFVHRDYLLSDHSSKKEVTDFISRNKKILVKQLNNTQGKGISLVLSDDPNLESIVDDIIVGSYVLEEYIHQHPVLDELNPSSVNTIRIGTAVDRGNKAHIVGACLRVGGKGKYVDNFHSGGIAYPIDVETGIVCGYGRSYTSSQKYMVHPTSQRIVLGLQIPHWEEAKASVVEAAQRSDKLTFLGWDIAITESGVEFIEANIGQDPLVIQLDQIGKKKMIMDILFR